MSGAAAMDEDEIRDRLKLTVQANKKKMRAADRAFIKNMLDELAARILKRGLRNSDDRKDVARAMFVCSVFWYPLSDVPEPVRRVFDELYHSNPDWSGSFRAGADPLSNWISESRVVPGVMAN